MELRMHKHKLNEEKVVREKEKLKKKVERQSVQLEQEIQEKKQAMVSYQFNILFICCEEIIIFIYKYSSKINPVKYLHGQ